MVTSLVRGQRQTGEMLVGNSREEERFLKRRKFSTEGVEGEGKNDKRYSREQELGARCSKKALIIEEQS